LRYAKVVTFYENQENVVKKKQPGVFNVQEKDGLLIVELGSGQYKLN
jgi:hypothetical protein